MPKEAEIKRRVDWAKKRFTEYSARLQETAIEANVPEHRAGRSGRDKSARGPRRVALGRREERRLTWRFTN
jgi:hypothetical protein